MGDIVRQFVYNQPEAVLMTDLAHDLRENFYRGLRCIPPKKIQIKIPGRIFALLYEPLSGVREKVSTELGFPRRCFCIDPHNSSSVELSITY